MCFESVVVLGDSVANCDVVCNFGVFFDKLFEIYSNGSIM